MSKVVFQEKPVPASIAVGKYLITKGFAIADSQGVADNSLIEHGYDSYHLLLPISGPDERDFLSRLLFRRRRCWIGKISNMNSAHWNFEFNGRQHTQLVKELAEELSTVFGVGVSVLLIKEVPMEERHMSDWDHM